MSDARFQLLVRRASSRGFDVFRDQRLALGQRGVLRPRERHREAEGDHQCEGAVRKNALLHDVFPFGSFVALRDSIHRTAASMTGSFPLSSASRSSGTASSGTTPRPSSGLPPVLV